MGSYQNGIIKRYYEHKDTLMLQKLSELVSDLFVAPGAKADRQWESARKALENLGVQPEHYNRIIAQRDVQELAKLVQNLSISGPPATPAGTSPTPATSAAPAASTPPPAAAPGATSITPETLRAAFKAFKKRLKLTRLDEESRLGRSPLSHQKARVVAIHPPREFPPAVWEELVKQGRLKPAGRGFYQMAEQGGD